MFPKSVDVIYFFQKRPLLDVAKSLTIQRGRFAKHPLPLALSAVASDMAVSLDIFQHGRMGAISRFSCQKCKKLTKCSEAMGGWLISVVANTYLL